MRENIYTDLARRIRRFIGITLVAVRQYIVLLLENCLHSIVNTIVKYKNCKVRTVADKKGSKLI